MSASLHDFASSTFIASGLAPAELTASANGSLVDMISADGSCFAVQHVGVVSGDATLAGHIEQSADASSWSAISGATFSDVTSTNSVQAITFTRTARYVRWVGAITGEDPSFQTAVLIGEQKKTI